MYDKNTSINKYKINKKKLIKKTKIKWKLYMTLKCPCRKKNNSTKSHTLYKINNKIRQNIIIVYDTKMCKKIPHQKK